MTRPEIHTMPRETLEDECLRLFSRVQWLEKQVFGSKSEIVNVNEDQMALDLGLEPQAPSSPEVQIVPEHERRVPRKHKSDIPENLPILSEEIINPDIDVSRCDIIGQEVTLKLAYVPQQSATTRLFAQSIVIERTAKYSLPTFHRTAMKKVLQANHFLHMSISTNTNTIYHFIGNLP